MPFEEYRRTLIHETPAIQEFLSDTRGEHFLIAAPKGFGKTLLLIAKMKQISEDGGFRLGFSSGGEIVDRPTGSFPEATLEDIDKYGTDLNFWKSAWWISILIAAIKKSKVPARETLTEEALRCDPWILGKLLDPVNYFSPCRIFTSLIESDKRTRTNVVRQASRLDYMLDGIREQIAFFIDNVDEYFKPILDNKTVGGLTPSETGYRNRSNEIWVISQIGLASAVFQLHRSTSHIKIFCTIRREALKRLDDFDVEFNQLLAKTIEIEYAKSDFEEIFLKNIRLMNARRLCVSQENNLLASFFGSSWHEMRHKFVDQRESAFDCLMRHTFSRPRDLMILGSAISSIPPERRNRDTVKAMIDGHSDRLADDLRNDMKPFFALPDPKELLPLVRTNVLSSEEIENVTKDYLARVSAKMHPSLSIIEEAYHPFSVLQKIGMLGWIEVNTEVRKPNAYKQRFTAPTDIVIKDGVGLHVTKDYYLIHPALDHMISDLSGPRYLTAFHSANIVGDECPWKIPAERMFVVKGDMCGFSKVMTSEYYAIVARKMHTWCESSCSTLAFFEVSGGDSVVMIDKSIERIIYGVYTLLELANEDPDYRVEFRFGGAVGPVAFSEFSRRANGADTKVIYPVGLALRTSARLEPYAPKGSIMVDEAFFNDIDNSNESLIVNEIGPEEISGPDYDHENRVFTIRKNKADEPYRTKLFAVRRARAS